MVIKITYLTFVVTLYKVKIGIARRYRVNDAP